MSPARRAEIAKKAAAKRWEKDRLAIDLDGIPDHVGWALLASGSARHYS